MNFDRNLKMVATEDFLNFRIFTVQISFTDYIKDSYSFITFQILEVDIAKVVIIHFSQIPFVVEEVRNLQVMLILEADLQI